MVCQNMVGDMNKDVYLCLRKPDAAMKNFFVEFVDEPHLAMRELRSGGRVFKLNALDELKEIDVTYTETTYE